MTHYDTLGVEPTATHAQIRKAYRRLAMRLHPDRNEPSDEITAEFQRVQEAYDVLSDPDRRAHYDQTGESKQRNAQAEAEAQLANLFMTMLEKTDAPEYSDLKAMVLQQINNQQTIMEHQIKDLERLARKYRSAVARIQRKTGKLNLIALSLEQKAVAVDRSADDCRHAHTMGGVMKEILAEYDYRVDVREQEAKRAAPMVREFTIYGSRP